MRVLFVNRLMGVFWGGGETFDYNITGALSAHQNTVTILTGKPLFGKPLNQINGRDVRFVATIYLRWICYRLPPWLHKLSTAIMLLDLILFERSVYAWIERHNDEFDVIEVLALPRLAKKIVCRLQKSVVIRYPGPPSPKRDKPLLIELSKTSRASFFAAGDAYRQAMAQGIPFLNIPQGVNSERFRKDATAGEKIRKKYGLAETDIVLISIGRLIAGKGFEFLLKGMTKAVKSMPNIKLMIVGDGALRGTLSAMSAGFEESVVLAGRIPNEELASYYSASDIFLLLSSYENFSNAVLEGMACSLPVIAARTGGLPLQIKDGENGLLVDYGDVNGLVRCIERLVVDKDLRSRMGAQNRSEIMEHYNWNITALHLEQIYAALMQGSR